MEVSLLSPFKSQRAFAKDRAAIIFKEASNRAIEKLQEESLISQLTDKDEALIIFD
jgi:hypothetical protein